MRLVQHHVVVLGVTSRVQQRELAGTEPEALAILDHPHARRRNRHKLPVQTREAFLAVDRLGARDELRGVDHVRRAARMQHRLRAGKLAHESARATGVIQVHVRQQQVIDRVARHAEFPQSGEQIGNRIVGADIHEGGAAGVNYDVRGGVPGIQVLAIHGGDAVRVPIKRRFHGNC
jgi:hypothetical protein